MYNQKWIGFTDVKKDYIYSGGLLMKFKRMASAVMATVMAVTSAVVCEVTASAQPIGFGASVSGTWEQADFVNSSSTEMANVDISNVTSVTFNAIAYDLNYGWNNGQFYVDGASWVTKSFGGTSSSVDVTIDDPSAFSVTTDFAAKDDGTWALGWGTNTAAGAFAIESIEFYAGANQLGIWTNGVWIGKDVAVTDVTLDKTTFTLEEGKTAALTATVTPDNATDKTVTWSSDATDVATVDSATGTITAVKAGTANITAKAGGKTATCAVTVTPVPVKTVTIDKPSQTTYKVGDTATLTASVNSDATVTDKDIVWSSSDDTVAAIDETTGAVEFKAEGTITITAAYKSDKTIKDTITLAVTNDEIPVSAVTIKRTGKNIYTVGDSLTLTANVNSDATVADKDIVWSSSDESIATIDENTGAVTFITNGHITFTASYKSDTTISDSVDITVLAADYVESVIEYNKTATTPTKIIIGNSDSVAYVMAISKADAEASSSVEVTITADGRTYTKTITTVYKQFKYSDNNGAKYIETGAADTYFVIVKVKGTTTVNSLSATMELVK